MRPEEPGVTGRPRVAALRLGLASWLAVTALVVPAAVARAQPAASPDFGPPRGDGAVRVEIGFALTTLVAVDEEEETFEFEGALTMRWRDPRAAFDPLAFGAPEKVYQGAYQFTELATGWWPQLTLVNEAGRYERQGLVLRVSPDGTMTYIEEVDGIAKAGMALRRFPFDRQHLDLVFEVLGFGQSEVELVPDAGATLVRQAVTSAAQWTIDDLTVDRQAMPGMRAGGAPVSAVTFTIGVTRDAGFVLRVIMAPLVMLVVLTWSVFWMDRESVGDRMDISFVGILTVVAFQIMVSEHLPRIGYFTLLGTFLYVNYLFLFASVVVNLAVSRLDRAGREARGETVDRVCRWLFPMAYAGLVLLVFAAFLRGA